MFQKIGEFLAALPSEIYVFIISILPFIELRGAVPVGAALGLPFYTNFAVSVVGNMLPVPLILLFIPRILDFLAKFKPFRPIVDWLRKKADKHSAKVLGKDAAAKSADSPSEDALSEETKVEAVEKGAEDTVKARGAFMSRGIFIGLLLFVALPIPGTGAWSGALVASLFGLSKRASFLAILIGVLICGIIMSLASYGVLGFLKFLI